MAIIELLASIGSVDNIIKGDCSQSKILHLQKTGSSIFVLEVKYGKLMGFYNLVYIAQNLIKVLYIKETWIIQTTKKKVNLGLPFSIILIIKLKLIYK